MYSIVQQDPNSKVQNHYKGIVNFMSLTEKKRLMEGFVLNHFLFQKLYFFFSHMINRVTIKNERLDQIRNQFQIIYLILENINTLFVNAIYELELFYFRRVSRVACTKSVSLRTFYLDHFNPRVPTVKFSNRSQYIIFFIKC